MKSIDPQNLSLPDVAIQSKATISSQLDWVGMAGIAIPFELKDSELGPVRCHGKASAFVDIARPEVKGIHMSRLYLLLEDYAEQEQVTPESLFGLLQSKLNTHADISENARVTLEFDFMIKRPALKTDYQGWKAYPSQITSEIVNGQSITEIKVAIPYSSTCPCSASLARQLLEQEMQKAFDNQVEISKEALSQWLLSDKGSYATPHSQRSFAYIKVRLTNTDGFPLAQLIDSVEFALQTPVQTAVKRADEQEFARLNGHNLMFCEDAARRVKHQLEQQEYVADFWLKVEHQESLHAHDAVAYATKGVAAGYKATTEY
jgi:GTP cyclohydrolase I